MKIDEIQLGCSILSNAIYAGNLVHLLGKIEDKEVI